MAGKKYFVLAVALVAGMCLAPASRADETVWSGLVLATTVEHPAEAPLELKKYAGQLKDIFGYNQYQLMGQHVEVMDSPSEHWLIPSKDFSLCVTARKASKPGFNYRLKLDLFQEKKLLAGMEGRLSGQNLLFIRGPAYGDGQLIIVLVVK
ncbi:MAG: hypothetical protein WCD79_04960 [Chthoniobacteraceae bacterium]